jgi:hypothetical protein
VHGRGARPKPTSSKYTSRLRIAYFPHFSFLLELQPLTTFSSYFPYHFTLISFLVFFVLYSLHFSSTLFPLGCCSHILILTSLSCSWIILVTCPSCLSSFISPSFCLLVIFILFCPSFVLVRSPPLLTFIWKGGGGWGGVRWGGVRWGGVRWGGVGWGRVG